MIGDVKGGLYHWSFESKTKIKNALTREPFGAVLGIVFAPDGKTLVTHMGRGGDSAAWSDNSLAFHCWCLTLLY